MTTIHPTNYIDGITNLPKSPDDFIGGARLAAIAMEKTIAKAKARDFAPIKLMYAGNAGVGKTALSYYAQHLLRVDRYAVHDLNGTDVTIDKVRDLSNTVHLSHNDLWGDYRLIAIHECDKMSSQAQVAFLSFCDKLPKRVCIICTTNMTISEGDKVERERFQSRFKYTEVHPPSFAEIAGFLGAKFQVPENVALQIATNCNGNVRMALLESEEYLDSVVDSTGTTVVITQINEVKPTEVTV